MISLTCAIPEHIRGGLRRCAIQIDVYFTLPVKRPMSDVPIFRRKISDV